MKKYLAFILIIIAITFVTYELQSKITREAWENLANLAKDGGPAGQTDAVAQGPCDQPLLYSVGSVDSRFGISTEEFQQAIAEAEALWENEMKVNIFDYAPEGAVKINLVFDERQQLSSESEALNQELDKLSSSVDSLDSKYAYLKKDYEKKTAEYEAAAKKYEKKQKDYNKDVNYWNSQGGAPEEEFKKLQEESDELNNEYDKLNKKRKEVNKLAEEINKLAEKEEKIVSSYNQKVNTYKNKYGESREFEKGIYSGREINIYQFNEMSDLSLVLAHELGHARGVGHLENPQALMYYLMADQDVEAPKLSAEDIKAVNNVCNR